MTTPPRCVLVCLRSAVGSSWSVKRSDKTAKELQCRTKTKSKRILIGISVQGAGGLVYSPRLHFRLGSAS